MENLSITQEYLICAVNEYGMIPSYSTDKMVCLVVGALLELQLEDAISLEDKKVRITGELPQGKAYLKPLYDYIQQKGIVRVTKLLEDYNITYTDRRFRELLGAIGESLATMGLVEVAEAGLLGNKTSYTPKKEAISDVIDQVRAELLKGNRVTDDFALLVILMNKSKCLNKYFSKFERKEMKEKLIEVTGSSEGKHVKRMVDYMQGMDAALFIPGLFGM